MSGGAFAFLPALLSAFPAAQDPDPSPVFRLEERRSRPVARIEDREILVGEILDRMERDYAPGLSKELDGPYGIHHLESPLFDRWIEDFVDLELARRAHPDLRVDPEAVRALAGERAVEEREGLARRGRTISPTLDPVLADRQLRMNGLALEKEVVLSALAEPVTADHLRAHFVRTSLQYGGKVRAAHLFFSKVDPETGRRLPLERREMAERRAREALGGLEEGAEFAELARTLSEDPKTAGKGGDLGSFSRRGSLVPDEVARAAFAARPGKVVGPVESVLGFHVVRVLGHEIVREPDFQKVRPEVERDLREERRREALLAIRASARFVLD